MLPGTDLGDDATRRDNASSRRCGSSVAVDLEEAGTFRYTQQGLGFEEKVERERER